MAIATDLILLDKISAIIIIAMLISDIMPLLLLMRNVHNVRYLLFYTRTVSELYKCVW